MGIKYDEVKNCWSVSYSRRHPITKKPVSIIRKNIKSKALALKLEKQLVLEMDQKLKKVIMPTWDSLLKAFINDFSKRDISKKTVECYEMCLVAHTKESWGRRFVDEITPQDIRQLIQNKVSHLSPSHQKKYFKVY